MKHQSLIIVGVLLYLGGVLQVVDADCPENALLFNDQCYVIKRDGCPKYNVLINLDCCVESCVRQCSGSNCSNCCVPMELNSPTNVVTNKPMACSGSTCNCCSGTSTSQCSNTQSSCNTICSNTGTGCCTQVQQCCTQTSCCPTNTCSQPQQCCNQPTCTCPSCPNTPIPDTPTPNTPIPTEPPPTSTEAPTTTPRPAEIKCPPGTIPIGRTCAVVSCPFGTVMDGDRCIQISCPEGTFWNGHKCAFHSPMVHNITIYNNIITPNNHSQPSVVITSNRNIMVNASFTINDETHHTCCGEDAVGPPETEAKPSCCTVKTPRTCVRRSSKWVCYSRKYKKCGNFCTAPTIYLEPPRVYVKSDIIVLPPRHRVCENSNISCGLNIDGYDCSVCGTDVHNCPYYCNRYICSTPKCAFIDQRSHCLNYPRSYGCTPEDGCYDEEWCNTESENYVDL
ncbi:uncharacterized protein LOC142219940 [Haematobia irritans]|uniref:uncharacterized protein LOC142219940 n=1 Tax=Haematobia irritans TaxID=7368 RepID=UPI003F4FD8FF